MVGLTGCGNGPGGGNSTPSSNLTDGNRNGSLTSAAGKTSGEPNDSFESAVVAVFDERGAAQLQGTVTRRGDRDVYLLGAMSPGDRIVVDTETLNSPLDISVAMFDAERRLTYSNDDRDPALRTNRDLDAVVDWIVRHAGSSYYLVVTNSAFASNGEAMGGYTVDVQVTRGLAVPQAAEQILLLDFEGGVVDSPALGRVVVAPFSAGAIDPVYDGQTDTLKELIRATMEQNFERFNVAIRTTDDPPLPDGAKFTTVFFGGFNSAAFGISESVDLYNADFCDDSIIFTETFAPFSFTRPVTVEELAIAIGNVASHETGHLLGLNHVDDDLAIMDDRSPADAFIEDQEFAEAPLSSDIMSIGTQDAALLLSEIVGSVQP